MANRAKTLLLLTLLTGLLLFIGEALGDRRDVRQLSGPEDPGVGVEHLLDQCRARAGHADDKDRARRRIAGMRRGTPSRGVIQAV